MPVRWIHDEEALCGASVNSIQIHLFIYFILFGYLTFI